MDRQRAVIVDTSTSGRAAMPNGHALDRDDRRAANVKYPIPSDPALPIDACQRQARARDRQIVGDIEIPRGRSVFSRPWNAQHIASCWQDDRVRAGEGVRLLDSSAQGAAAFYR